MGWRDICRSTDERTVIAAFVPRTAVGHTFPLFFIDPGPQFAAAIVGNLNSLILDFVARQKVGGTHLTSGYLKQFPVLRRSEEHTSELQSLMRISYAVFCLKKKNRLEIIK